MIYLLTAIGLTPGGSSTVHIYTQKIHRTIQNNTTILEECGPCPVLASYTLEFALQLRKKHGKTFDPLKPAAYFTYHEV
jgi:H2-forming N5,N10-methylenetetrahydromethanopterin dehydrogenase-like enzyme